MLDSCSKIRNGTFGVCAGASRVRCLRTAAVAQPDNHRWQQYLATLQHWKIKMESDSKTISHHCTSNICKSSTILVSPKTFP
jgi:hypothetical protein